MAPSNTRSAEAPLSDEEFVLELTRRCLTDEDYTDMLGSTYCFEMMSPRGRVHLLFRLHNGDPTRPTPLAIYVDGRQIKVRPAVAKKLIRAACEAGERLLD